MIDNCANWTAENKLRYRLFCLLLTGNPVHLVKQF
jgi:hypothetical protein